MEALTESRLCTLAHLQAHKIVTQCTSAQINAITHRSAHLNTITHRSAQINAITHTGRAKKSNPLGKMLYLWNCSRYIYQICRDNRRGFSLHILL